MKALLIFITTFLTFGVFAQDVPVENVDASFLASAWAWVQSLWSDTPLLGKITGGVILIVSSWKVSFLKPLWDKLGEKQEWVAPVLGLLGGVAALFVNGEFDLSLLLTSIAGGALAPYVHDLLDYLKAIPGIGKVWLTIIDIIKMVLLAPKENSDLV